MDSFTRKTIIFAIERMFNQCNNFDICLIRECLALADMDKHDPRVALLRIYHCVDWKEMPDETREELARLVGELFGAALELRPVAPNVPLSLVKK